MNATGNAVRWQSDILPSRRAGQIQWACQLAVLLVLLLSPWSWLWAPAKLLVACWVCREGRQSRRRFRARAGHLSLDNQDYWQWQQQRWQTCRRPGWLPFAVLLSLENEQGKRCRFWLMQDAMPPAAWRGLRMHWFYGRLRQR